MTIVLSSGPRTLQFLLLRPSLFAKTGWFGLQVPITNNLAKVTLIDSMVFPMHQVSTLSLKCPPITVASLSIFSPPRLDLCCSQTCHPSCFLSSGHIYFSYLGKLKKKKKKDSSYTVPVLLVAIHIAYLFQGIFQGIVVTKCCNGKRTSKNIKEQIANC